MGVYIKGMEMPKGIEMIVVFSDGTVHKCLPGMRNYVEKGIAIPVPPHGRLIDADALIANHFSDEHRIALSYANKCWMRRIINGEPTIIPEEERET